MHRPFILGSTALVFAVATSAAAEEPAEKKAMKNFIEVGLFGGALFPAKQHNFHDENMLHQSFKPIAPELGGRLAYFPLSMLGAEFEGAVAPTKTRGDDKAAGIWAVRAHAMAQLPFGGVTPFALLGMGRMGAGSNATGSDNDPTVHFGAGVKVPFDDFVGLRFDVRDNLSQKNDASKGAQVHHPEVLLGLTFSLDLRSKPKLAPKDRDADGFVDEKDKCPTESGVAPNGCPKPADADADGVDDARDACPEEAGVPSEVGEKNGCPAPKDPDADGVPDPDDKCPADAGIAPDGCPDADPDKDGIKGSNDKCADQAETTNGYQDTDGCPDEVPAELEKFSGVVKGIEFDTGRATIRPASKPALEEALKTLRDNPGVRIEISGHTDDAGDAKRNADLSQKRADAVKEYFVSQGIDASRITTRGAGPDQPIADNKTADGRQKNRRIEFKLLTQ